MDCLWHTIRLQPLQETLDSGLIFIENMEVHPGTPAPRLTKMAKLQSHIDK